jgi:hypothetical protein
MTERREAVGGIGRHRHGGDEGQGRGDEPRGQGGDERQRRGDDVRGDERGGAER